MEQAKVALLNTFFNSLTCGQAVDAIDGFIRQKKKAYVVEVNTDVVIKIENDPYLKQITDEADLVLADGKPLIWISKWFRRPLAEKVSGSDLTLALCQRAAQAGYSVFLLGGAQGVGEKARERLEKQFPGLRVAGVYSPPMGFEKDAGQLARVNALLSAARPDLVIVCFGCPKQEKWIYENYKKIEATVFLCAGGTVNFLAGNVQRAPKWMSDHGLEWFFRFLMEPKRLFKRYFIDDMKIIRLIFKYR